MRALQVMYFNIYPYPYIIPIHIRLHYSSFHSLFHYSTQAGRFIGLLALPPRSPIVSLHSQLAFYRHLRHPKAGVGQQIQI